MSRSTDSAPPSARGSAPSFPLGHPKRPWREESLARAAELETLTDWFRLRNERGTVGSPADDALEAGLRRHLTAARDSATAGRMSWFKEDARHAKAASNLDAAEADLLRLLPLGYLSGQLPGLLAHIRRHLPNDDPRRQSVETLTQDARRGQLGEVARETLVGAVRAASSAAQREQRRVSNFRWIVLAAAGVLFVMALLVGMLGWVRPELVPLCFEPQDEGMLVCPTHESRIAPRADIDPAVRRTVSGWDVPLVEFVGMVAAAVTSAVALRRMRGTSTPFAVPVALTVLKLPTGALTAFLGVLLMRGGFVPGLTALDNTPQILAWAVVFGASQQLVTGLVDKQAQDVLDSVGGKTYTPTGGS